MLMELHLKHGLLLSSPFSVFPDCSCHLILATVLKWFPQSTDEGKTLILLRKNLMNDQMYWTVFMTDDVPLNPASYVSVILHCESLADKLVFGMFVVYQGRNFSQNSGTSLQQVQTQLFT